MLKIFPIMDKTIRVNDVIKIGDIKGRVVRMGLRNTLIRTEAGNIALIGKSNLMSGPFVNLTSSNRFSDQCDKRLLTVQIVEK